MEIVNATKMPAAYTMGLDPHGREHVIVVVKGTFRIPREGEEVALAEKQAPLVMADEFTGEPGVSAVLYESDFALEKPRCDVLLNGSAHAPQGHRARHLIVSLRVGTMTKRFRVLGDRVWERKLLSLKPGEPEPFERMPISYDRAFGGADVSPKDPERVDTYVKNPAGVGHYPLAGPAELPGRPLPNTEEVDRPVEAWKGKYEPMSFGAIGRNFPARVAFAGTYDQAWLNDVAPFLPADFDPRYYQAAPADQQIEHPTGGEGVELVHLTPTGRTRFTLPRMEVPVEFTNADYERIQKRAVLDTIVLEPDLDRLLLVWRTSLPLRDNIFEVLQAVVGRMPPGWYRARELGKTWHPTLADAVRNGGGGP